MKKATEVWSDLIRQVGKCEICGLTGVRGIVRGWRNLEAHHLIPRGILEYRCELSNGICLCYQCHKRNPDWSPHANRDGFEQFLKAYRPGQYHWYNRHCPKDLEKEIDGRIVMCRRVITTSGWKPNWMEIYEELREMYDKCV